MQWKYRVFRNWVFTPPKISFRYKDDGTKYPKSFWFRTVRHPEITYFWKKFYPRGKKVIQPEIDIYLNPVALAIWIMDDGSYSKKTISINTYAFPKEQIKISQKAIEKNFQTKSKCYPDRDKGYRLFFSYFETTKLIAIIEKHIISSMLYKIGLSR